MQKQIRLRLVGFITVILCALIILLFKPPGIYEPDYNKIKQNDETIKRGNEVLLTLRKLKYYARRDLEAIEEGIAIIIMQEQQRNYDRRKKEKP